MEMPKKRNIHEVVPFDCSHIEEKCNKYLKEGYFLTGILPSISPSEVLLSFKSETEFYKKDSPFYKVTSLKYFKCMELLPQNSNVIFDNGSIDHLIKELHDTHPENEFCTVASYATFSPKKGIVVFAVF